MITLTPNAVNKVRSLMTEQEQEVEGLRIGVRPGGCSGFQYELHFDRPGLQDQTARFDGVLVIVDPESAAMLNGATLDFEDGLQGSGFKFDNPNSTRSCGCGQSFS